MRISDWSSDVCSSDLAIDAIVPRLAAAERPVRGRVAKVVEHHPPIEHAARTAIPPTIPGVPVIRHPPSMRFDAAETAIAGSISPAAVGVQRHETHIPERPFSLPLAPHAPPPDPPRSRTGWVGVAG